MPEPLPTADDVIAPRRAKLAVYFPQVRVYGMPRLFVAYGLRRTTINAASLHRKAERTQRTTSHQTRSLRRSQVPSGQGGRPSGKGHNQHLKCVDRCRVSLYEVTDMYARSFYSQQRQLRLNISRPGEQN